MNEEEMQREWDERQYEKRQEDERQYEAALEEAQASLNLMNAAHDLLAACELGQPEDPIQTGPELLRKAADWLASLANKQGISLGGLISSLRLKADAEEAAARKARQT